MQTEISQRTSSDISDGILTLLVVVFYSRSFAFIRG